MLIEKCVDDSLISCLPFVVCGIGMAYLFFNNLFYLLMYFFMFIVVDIIIIIYVKRRRRKYLEGRMRTWRVI